MLGRRDRLVPASADRRNPSHGPHRAVSSAQEGRRSMSPHEHISGAANRFAPGDIETCQGV